MREIIANIGKNNPKFVHLSRAMMEDKAEPLKEIPFDQLENLDQIRSLHMANHAIEYLSPRIGELTALEWLDLNDNLIIELPEAIGNLSNLKMIRIGDCVKWHESDYDKIMKIGNQFIFDGPYGLSRLPGSFKNLTQLEAIKFDGNRFEIFPKEICSLTKLQHIDMSFNILKEIPEEIGNLTNLTYLQLSRNNFHALPESMGQLKKLQRLRLDGLHLYTLPESIYEMESLQMLEICNGILEEIPSSIKHFKHLKYFYLLDTKLSDVDKNMLKVLLPDTHLVFNMDDWQEIHSK